MPMGFRVGETAGRYQVLKFLGRGNFGEVLLAQDPGRPNRPVALKTVTCDQLSGDSAENARRAALSEAQLLRRLRHPHIVSCNEVEWDAERRTVWFALEFMDGGDLQSLLDARRESGIAPFDDHFVRRVLAAVGSALQYIHGEGVLHRDVKPANVLVTRRSQRIKLGDFGIAKLLKASGRARTVVGTPYYLSPELVSGQDYGPAADAWALGVCLYELASLRRPFEASNPLALVRRICEEPVEALPKTCAPDICEAVFGLLEREQNQRIMIADALAVSDAVAILATGPAGDEPISQLTADIRNSAVESDSKPVFDFSQLVDAADAIATDHGELSPVSIVVSENAFESNSGYGETEIYSSLLSPKEIDEGLDSVLNLRSLQQAGVDTALVAARQARIALSSDIDDPEELQEALHALEQEQIPASSPLVEAVDSLCRELRLRITALRADAAAMLRSLLEPQAPESHADMTATSHVEIESSATFVEGDASDIPAIETAIEVATTLGLDTCPAEITAASARGLISLRVLWGASVRCCMLRVGACFDEVAHEVACRFGFPSGSSDGLPGLEFVWRDNGSALPVRDQVSWEACLRRLGLLSRPGRLELHVETPFIVMGTAYPRKTISTSASGARPLSGNPRTSQCAPSSGSRLLPPPLSAARSNAQISAPRRGALQAQAATRIRHLQIPTPQHPRRYFLQLCRRPGSASATGAGSVNAHMRQSAAPGNQHGASTARRGPVSLGVK